MHDLEATLDGKRLARELFRLSEAPGKEVADRLIGMAEDLVGGATLDERIEAVQFGRNEAGFDPFGFDPELARYVFAVGVLLHRRYFRTQVFGAENVPQGRVLLVSNHSGQVPLDGLAISMSLMLDKDPPVFARSMVERWTAQLPVASWLLPRLGQVLGAPENARRLLRDDRALMVFPEGVRGIAKPFSKRYQLQQFGSGFMRLAIETGAPVVPIAVIGAEEQYPSLATLSGLAQRLGMPAFPIVPQLWLGLWMPLPVRYRVYFGEPMVFGGDADDADDAIERQVSQVREAIEKLIQRGLSERQGIFW